MRNNGLSMSTIFFQSHTASTNTIKFPIRMIICFLQIHFTNDTRLARSEPSIKAFIGNKNRIKNLPTSNTSNKSTLILRDDLLHYHPNPFFFRVGNSGQRVGFVSTRLTRLHNRVQHEPDPIINRVITENPNTTQ